MTNQVPKSTKHMMQSFSKRRAHCSSSKIRYRDRRMAITGLHHAQNIGAIALAETGYTTRKESRVYFCSECGGFHLSSKPELSDLKLAA